MSSSFLLFAFLSEVCYNRKENVRSHECFCVLFNTMSSIMAKAEIREHASAYPYFRDVRLKILGDVSPLPQDVRSLLK